MPLSPAPPDSRLTPVESSDHSKAFTLDGIEEKSKTHDLKDINPQPIQVNTKEDIILTSSDRPRGGRKTG